MFSFDILIKGRISVKVRHLINLTSSHLDNDISYKALQRRHVLVIVYKASFSSVQLKSKHLFDRYIALF